MTEGERQFSSYCSRNGICYQRIPETHDEKTADHLIHLNEGAVLVEVKDFDMNRDESDALREYNREGVAVWGSSKPGARIRSKIDSAHSQLRKARGLRTPALLVLYDNRDPAVAILSEYEILVAMYGLQTIEIGGENDGQSFFGGGRQMTPECRTYISGIGILTRESILDIYLNWFAEYPLSSISFPADSRVRVYALPHFPGDGFSGWVPLTTPADGKTLRIEATRRVASIQCSRSPKRARDLVSSRGQCSRV